MSKYKVGDKVLIKKWEDMVYEFGLDKYGDVNIEIYFAHDMQQFCNKICEIIEVDDYIFKIKEDDFGYWFSDDMIERKVNDMTKSDLRSGMIVETRKNSRFIVIIEENNKINFLNLNDYDYYYNIDDNFILNNMCHTENSDLDIMKIYKMSYSLCNCKATQDLIWERQEKREMTIAEIEKELGYSIKIIKDDFI